MKAQDLKNSILQLAMEGKLVPQDPSDEPASVLLDGIREEKKQLVKDKKIKRNNKESFIFRKNNHFYEKIGKKGEPVCIDDEIPFEIPESWKWCRLDNIIFTTPTKRYQILKSEIKNKGKLPVISQSSIFIEGYSNNYEKLLKIINPVIIFGDHTKNVKYIDFDFIVGADGVKILNPILIYPLFLYYLIEHAKINMKDRGYSRHFQFLKEKFYPIPPFNEQKRIVEKINELLLYVNRYNYLKEELTKLNDNFPELIKKSILQEAIQGKLVPQDSSDEPASVLLDGIREEKKQLVKDKKIKRNNKESFIFKENNHFYEKIGKNGEPVCIDDEIPFDIPENWEWVKLGEISFITKLAGFEYTKYISPNLTTKGVPLLKAKNIKNNRLIKSFDDYIPNKVSDNLIRSKLNKKCILTPYVGASIGNVVYFDKSFEAHLAPNLAKIVMYGNISEEYIVYYIKSNFGYFELTKNIKSTAQPSVSMKSLRDMILPLPPLNEQNKIVNKLNKIMDLFDK